MKNDECIERNITRYFLKKLNIQEITGKHDKFMISKNFN